LSVAQGCSRLPCIFEGWALRWVIPGGRRGSSTSVVEGWALKAATAGLTRGVGGVRTRHLSKGGLLKLLQLV
jgi:hypothetical protein